MYYAVCSLGYLTPSLLAKLLYRLWIVAPRFVLPDNEKLIRDQALIQHFKINQRSIASYHWPQAELLKTTGPGHRRILRDPRAIDSSLAFIHT